MWLLGFSAGATLLGITLIAADMERFVAFDKEFVGKGATFYFTLGA